MMTSRVNLLLADLFHIFYVLPLRLKVLALFLASCYLFSAFWDFLSLIYIGFYIQLVSSSGDLDTNNIDFSYALRIASSILDLFPSQLYYPLIYFFVLGSICFRVYLLFLNPLVVRKISSFLSSCLMTSYTSMSVLSFTKVSLSEFRTVLSEDLTCLINIGVRASLAFSSSIFILLASCVAAYIASPFLFMILSLSAVLFYFLYNVFYFRRVSSYISKTLPSLDRARSSLLEHIFHSFDLIKLYRLSSRFKSSFSTIVSSRDYLVSAQTRSVSLPRLVIEFLIMFIFIFLGSLHLSQSYTLAFDAGDFGILLLSLIKASSAFQLMFHHSGTILSNSMQIHNASSLIKNL